MNSIDAKGYNFLQQNSPGNDGYGQIGLKGETGEDGNSVYFTPYILSLSSNVGICDELIREGKELSDNPEYESKSVIYKVNDIIIDKLGDVYILKNWSSDEHDTLFNIVYLNNIFTQGNITGSDLSCILNVVFTDPTSEYYYKKRNDNFLGEYNGRTGSPHIYHRDRYQEKLCGGWISFSIPTADQEYRNFIYKYVIMLPNGQRIEKVTNASACDMFLDNRYFYSCRFSQEVNDELKSLANYKSINNTGEYEPEFTYKLLTEGVALCKAYVEITNRDSHLTYRLYANTISLEGVEELNESEE